jgi:hypothetical protein
MPGFNAVLRTMRISSCNGYRSLGSMIADGVSAGAGSCQRIIKYYMIRQRKGDGFTGTYKKVFDINFGQFKNSKQFQAMAISY